MQKFSGSNAVFVGNIPFDCTEAHMIEIFKEVGPVSNFRINRDRETGRPKGYGFCEFLDAATAASAVRNLDGYDIGGRQLKVAPAEADANNNQSKSNFQGNPNNQNQQNLPPQNIGGGNKQEIRPPFNSNEAINHILSSMSPPQIFELITQVNMMIQLNTNNAKLLLAQNPQLCFALVQAIKIMNLVDDNSNNTMSYDSPGHDIRPPMPNQMQGFQRMPPGNQPNFSHSPAHHQRPPPFASHHQTQFRPPPNEPIKSDQQDALIRQVMSMSNSEIDLLPPEQRQNLLRLRAQILGGHGNGSN
ncbi:hypothetical protein K502DRAFT_326145 [Neoconidiobolus thromboides FSU 785]|nr:hypothetical protein K502DRAFT_326145 [Neoconidiobolus thromboides FSU 785]